MISSYIKIMKRQQFRPTIANLPIKLLDMISVNNHHIVVHKGNDLIHSNDVSHKSLSLFIFESNIINFQSRVIKMLHQSCLSTQSTPLQSSSTTQALKFGLPSYSGSVFCSRYYLYNHNRYYQHSCSFSFSSAKPNIQIDYKKDYYEILDLEPNALLPEIKNSFYKKAKKCHPDMNFGDQATFKAITEAYNILSNEDRRALYDRNRVIKQDQLQGPDLKRQYTRKRTQTATSTTANQGDPKNNKYSSHSNSSKASSEQSNNDNGYTQEQFQNVKKQAYYHYSRGQWQYIRSGYMYQMQTKEMYYENMTNNTNSETNIYNRFKNAAEKRERANHQLNDQFQNYFKLRDKIERKKQLNRLEYELKLKEIENRFYRQKKQAFNRSLIGRMSAKFINWIRLMKTWYSSSKRKVKSQKQDK